MRKAFVALAVLDAAMFAYAPFAINAAPYESTMLLIQKIFYFHFATWMACTLGLVVCGVSSAWYLFKGSETADRVAVASAELVVIFTLFGLVSGSLWARKAWGIWWDWEPRLTMSFVGWLISVSYLFVRKYAGPGSDKLGAALAIFGSVNVPFIYVSVNVWRTMHPKTTVVPSLQPGMRGPFWFSFLALLLLYVLLMTARVHLERQRTALDELFLAEEDAS